MPPISSAGQMSSRSFTARELKAGLNGLTPDQARHVRKLARKLGKRANLGYYAALDTVAVIGLFISQQETSTKST